MAFIIKNLAIETDLKKFELEASHLMSNEKIFETWQFYRFAQLKKQLDASGKDQKILGELAKCQPLILEKLFDKLEEESASPVEIKIKALYPEYQLSSVQISLYLVQPLPPRQ